MDSFPINCHNCFSHKRSFYVFLQCKHFICLNCCLCLANFQTLTIRCCHRNTKMSEQLTAAMFEQIKTRKQLQNSEIDKISEEIDKINVIRMETLPSRFQTEHNKSTTNMNRLQFKSIEDKMMSQSQVVHTFKRIDDQKSFDEKNYEKRNNQAQESKNRSMPIQYPLKEKQIHFLSTKQTESPTFKQIELESYVPAKFKNQYNEDFTKQNYLYWKHYDSPKDRILAKLNYHQQKMNNLIRQHY